MALTVVETRAIIGGADAHADVTGRGRGLLGSIEATVAPGGGPESHAYNNQAETFCLLSAERSSWTATGPSRSAVGSFVTFSDPDGNP